MPRPALLAVLLIVQSCAPRDATPPLACLAADSLRNAPLLFSDAIWGMRGTSGGTIVELLRDTAWSAVIEPVWSDFEENNRWPELTETLSVRWAELPAVRATLARRPHPDSAMAGQGLADSLLLEMSCDTTRLLRWHGGQLDTLLLERRRQKSYPY